MSSIYDWSIVAANNATSDSLINWQEGQAPSTVNNSARQLEARVAEILADMGGGLTAGGTANALTVTANSAFTAYANGLILALRIATDNSGAATLNANGLGAKSIRKMVAAGETALAGAEMQADGIYLLRYSTALNAAAGGWLLLNPTIDIAGLAALTGAAFTGAVSITGAATSPFSITSTDAGATPGPVVTMLRDSASPAASDLIGEFLLQGRNSSAGLIQYNAFGSQILDATAGSEDGLFYFTSYVAGANGFRLYIGAGVYTPNATGGDKGIDTINASGYYLNGVAFPTLTQATAAQYRANTAGLVLTTDKVWSAAGAVALTDAATITVDMSTFINATVTLGGNRTLGQPSNAKVGQAGCIEIVQDGTGSRTLAYHADWFFAGGTDPTLSTAAGSRDLLFYQVLASGKTFASLTKAVA